MSGKATSDGRVQSCGTRRAEHVSLRPVDCSAGNTRQIVVVCVGWGLAARLRQVMHVHAVHTVGVPPLLLLETCRQAEEVLDGQADGAGDHARE